MAGLCGCCEWHSSHRGSAAFQSPSRACTLAHKSRPSNQPGRAAVTAAASSSARRGSSSAMLASARAYRKCMSAGASRTAASSSVRASVWRPHLTCTRARFLSAAARSSALASPETWERHGSRAASKAWMRARSPPRAILPARRQVRHISFALNHASRSSLSDGLATQPSWKVAIAPSWSHSAICALPLCRNPWGVFGARYDAVCASSRARPCSPSDTSALHRSR
mmetsp:Transcript_19556/g.56299  ORF Transcript_19556/g.56299 Transcript_19556/m.56299 type:complete len:225 (-) Transcript_19556:88-762(-)